VSARQTAVTPWETRIGVRVECPRCDYTVLRRSSSGTLQVAREHAEETGHALNVTKIQDCTVSGDALCLVAPAVEPNPHVQQTWDAARN
jgi:hypothetical protein